MESSESRSGHGKAGFDQDLGASTRLSVEPTAAVMLPSVLLKQAADAAASEAISLDSWLEMAIQTALQQARLVAEEEELTADRDGERLKSRIERIETKLELFNQLLSRMQRIEDRLDLLD